MTTILTDLLSQKETQVSMGKTTSIAPGLWRLFGVGIQQPAESKLHMCDLLLVRRQFHVSIHRETGKRRAAEEVAASDSKKIKKVEDITEVILNPPPQNEVVDKPQKTARVDGAQVSASILEDPILLTDLKIGETAWVETEYSISSPSVDSFNKVVGPLQGQRGNKDDDDDDDKGNYDHEYGNDKTSNYQLSRLEMVGQTDATAVFACKHSATFSDNIVAKVLRYSGAGRGLKSLVKS